jgi:hypothetical protein
MSGATQQDAMVLLKLSEIAAIDGMPMPLAWLSGGEFDRDYSAFRRKSPPGSEHFDRAMKIVQHMDWIATMWRHHVVDHGLLADWIDISDMWDRLGGFVRGVRDELRSPRLAENFELMARTEARINALGLEAREVVSTAVG